MKKIDYELVQGPTMADALKSWTMVVLTLAFVILYGAALIGWLQPLADEKMVLRLEPIIFVFIGYYFGRLPAQQNENALKDEINRQTQKAEAVQHAKEQAQQAREALDEKVKNVLVVLAPAGLVKSPVECASTLEKDEVVSGSVFAALNILNS